MNHYNEQLTSLITHVKLSDDNWADQARQNILAAALFESDSPMTIERLISTVDQMGTKVKPDITTQILNEMIDQGQVIRKADNTYSLTQSTRSSLTKKDADTREVITRAEAAYGNLLRKKRRVLQEVLPWMKFVSGILTPLLKRYGAELYNLVTDEGSVPIEHETDDLLAIFEEDVRADVRDFVREVFESTDENLRDMFLRSLNIYFLVESIALSKETIEALSSNRKPRLILFADTNFLFSLMKLHTNDQDESVDQLVELLNDSSEFLVTDIKVLRPTVDEFRKQLSYQRDELDVDVITPHVARGLLESQVPNAVPISILQNSVGYNRNIKVDEYFDPYINATIKMLEKSNVGLFDHDLSNLSMQEKVLDDIEFQRNRENQKRERGKPYESIKHDMVIWHYVRSLRERKETKSRTVMEYVYWIITLDFGLVRFDQMKCDHGSSDHPICISPKSLLQLIQFWVPNSTSLDNSLLMALRHPVMYQEFDNSAEIVTTRLIETITHYRDVQKLSPSIVKEMLLDKKLRSKIAVTIKPEDCKMAVEEKLIEITNKQDEELTEKGRSIENLTNKLDAHNRDREDQARLLKRTEGELKSTQQSQTQLLALVCLYLPIVAIVVIAFLIGDVVLELMEFIYGNDRVIDSIGMFELLSSWIVIAICITIWIAIIRFHPALARAKGALESRWIMKALAGGGVKIVLGVSWFPVGVIMTLAIEKIFGLPF